MNIHYTLLFLLFLSVITRINAQNPFPWNGKKCAVVLTYDDALNVHLDNVITSLDSFDIKGTFYLQGESPVIRERLDEWRLAAENGHELGNHSLTHPCIGEREGRSWVSEEKDLSNYSVYRAVNEIKITSTLLQAIDGKTERTFAYPCGDSYIDSINYYTQVQENFIGARGVITGMQQLNDININDIQCYMINGNSGAEMINLVNKATESNTLLVFLFHGVGGEHGINVSLEAHQQLIHYLVKHQKEIWIAPLVEVAKYIKQSQIQNNTFTIK